MNIQDFLIWLLNSGGSIIIVSWLLEQWGWYQLQTPALKRNLFFGFSVLVATSAYGILTFVPADTLQMIAPFFQIFYVTFSTIFLGTKFHKETKVNKNNSELINILKELNKSQKATGATLEDFFSYHPNCKE
jgi:hypothetical protein